MRDLDLDVTKRKIKAESPTLCVQPVSLAARFDFAV